MTFDPSTSPPSPPSPPGAVPPEAAPPEDPGEAFVPYIRSEQRIPELTLAAVLLGLAQAVLFGVADAYLGLKLGMTVGASIPAAVISMGILRGILKRGTVLENNVVQNMASVGESLAGGVAFTVPALFLLAAKQGTADPTVIQVFTIAALGGMLGILFMIPLRRSLIVKEHGRLTYPEGTACAEVLIAGDEGGASARTVFHAIAVAGIYRFCMNGLDLFKEKLDFPIFARTFGAGGVWTQPLTSLSFDMLPSLLAVGFIIGLSTSAMMLSGALLGWFVILPCISWIGHDLNTVVPPAKALIRDMGPDELRLAYLRYIGAGGVALGGLVSLGRSLPTIIVSFRTAVREIRSSLGGPRSHGEEVPRTSRDIPLGWVLGGSFGVFLLLTGVLYAIVATMDVPVNRPLVALLGGFLATMFAFFFVTVSSRIVGIVGTTSMPTAGMTIGALIVTCLILKWLHLSGVAGILATLVVGAVVCIAISIGGDISQDLKIGFLVGATPRVVQTTQMLAVLVSAASIGVVLHYLAPLVVKGQLEAPQANLIYILANGIMQGELPWVLVGIGAAIAACVELLGVGSLPFAIGLYLPLGLSTTVMIGGVLAELVMRRLPERAHKDASDHGLLVASGLVAGDAIVGVVLGVLMAFDRTFTLLPVSRDLGDAPGVVHLLPTWAPPWQWWDWPTAVLFAAVTWYLWRRVMDFARRREGLPAPGEQGAGGSK